MLDVVTDKKQKNNMLDGFDDYEDDDEDWNFSNNKKKAADPIKEKPKEDPFKAKNNPFD